MSSLFEILVDSVRGNRIRKPPLCVCSCFELWMGNHAGKHSNIQNKRTALKQVTESGRSDAKLK